MISIPEKKIVSGEGKNEEASEHTKAVISTSFRNL